VQALMHTAEQHGMQFKILQAVEEVNEAQKKLLFEMVSKHFGGPRGQEIRGLGPRLQAAHRRHARSAGGRGDRAPLGAGAKVVAHDPEAMEEAKKHHLGDKVDLRGASPWTRSKAPTRLILSPSGTSSAARTSKP
jgi:UDPglucose 6-dehydrogenase